DYYCLSYDNRLSAGLF
nr:immunoglobulin light chain junction region [Macaca mulatta]MOW66377.1 immunoglobulin light chain junction region [Macaca mulatta]MOW66383.1 immunoglobulin light chain junction region [Macaca mulatta]MOW66445.1 immunoglobulin light chain junction region [Macaca mulatta]MOW66557.1 immunoglobulin light chain junction region [Macaca mulatta]